MQVHYDRKVIASRFGGWGAVSPPKGVNRRSPNKILSSHVFLLTEMSVSACFNDAFRFHLATSKGIFFFYINMLQDTNLYKLSHKIHDTSPNTYLSRDAFGEAMHG